MHEYIDIKFISETKGRGAFAKKNIEKGTVIDVALVILLTNEDYEKISETDLNNYCYIWEDPKLIPAFKNAITMSISQLMNHSYRPNIKYLYDYDNKAIEYSAIKNIKKGDELTVNYNGLIKDKSPMWFEVID